MLFSTFRLFNKTFRILLRQIVLKYIKMNNTLVLITNKTELKETIRELLFENGLESKKPEFEKEKLNRTQAIKLVGVSSPTFTKMISKDIFTEHGYGRKKFFLKSEIICALTKESKKKSNKEF